jgi:hypothetical protein
MGGTARTSERRSGTAANNDAPHHRGDRKRQLTPCASSSGAVLAFGATLQHPERPPRQRHANTPHIGSAQGAKTLEPRGPAAPLPAPIPAAANRVERASELACGPKSEPVGRSWSYRGIPSANTATLPDRATVRGQTIRLTPFSPRSPTLDSQGGFSDRRGCVHRIANQYSKGRLVEARS